MRVLPTFTTESPKGHLSAKAGQGEIVPNLTQWSPGEAQPSIVQKLWRQRGLDIVRVDKHSHRKGMFLLPLNKVLLRGSQ